MFHGEKKKVINEETEDLLSVCMQKLKRGAEVILLLLKNVVFMILLTPFFILHCTVKALPWKGPAASWAMCGAAVRCSLAMGFGYWAQNGSQQQSRGLKTNSDFKQPFVRTYLAPNDLILSLASWAKLDYIKKKKKGKKPRKTNNKNSDQKKNPYQNLHAAAHCLFWTAPIASAQRTHLYFLLMSALVQQTNTSSILPEFCLLGFPTYVSAAKHMHKDRDHQIDSSWQFATSPLNSAFYSYVWCDRSQTLLQKPHSSLLKLTWIIHILHCAAPRSTLAMEFKFFGYSF